MKAAMLGLTAALCWSSSARSDWWLQYPDAEHAPILMDETNYPFQLDRFRCLVDAAPPQRSEEALKRESRTLRCKLAPDLMVEITVTCSLPQVRYGELILTRGITRLRPTLTCARSDRPPLPGK